MAVDFWNERYAAQGLVYGDAPNGFLAQVASDLPRAGQAIDLAAGEGRNAIFLASLGLDVLAVDQSEVGLRKAAQLASERGLALRTQVADLAVFDAGSASCDVVTSISCHLPTDIRAPMHARVRTWLRPGGVFVLEAYAPDQIGRNTGGPKDPAMLASLETLVAELAGLEIVHQAALVRDVREGAYHTGEASVVQVIARKA